MTDINLHFTGDFAAIAAANNLLAALIDNHVHHGNALDIDVRSVTWKRVLDINDRALREVVVGAGRRRQRVPARGRVRHRGRLRADGDLLPHRVVGRPEAPHRRHRRRLHPGDEAGHRRDLGADGAMAVLLRDALAPNLVQTLEGAPAFVHGGPFANIAHGCSSVIATRAGLRLADYVVTEAGFGADLGAEKFVDIKCRKSGLRPDVAVVVATVRALKYHGGVALPTSGPRTSRAVEAGMVEPAPAPRQHPGRVRRPVRGRGQPVPDRHRRARSRGSSSSSRSEGVSAFPATHFVDGGVGAQDLAEGRAAALDEPSPYTFWLHLPRRPVADREGRGHRHAAVRRRAGHLGRQGPAAAAAHRARRVRQLPVCVAKTQYSFSTDPTLRGAPVGPRAPRARGPALRRRRLRGLVCGDMMTMPGLPGAVGGPDRPHRRRDDPRPLLTPLVIAPQPRRVGRPEVAVVRLPTCTPRVRVRLVVVRRAGR